MPPAIERPTHVWPVNPDHPQSEVIARAAAILRLGGLVAFPTETVYGLGASALDPEAVAKIYAAKGRPSNNPLIVHIAEAGDARPLLTVWPISAQMLAERFWPGPLTIVLPRTALIPDIVAGGGLTVALRCPAHPVAHSLIKAAGVPIAAPSANRSSELSPTLAEHVLRSLVGRIDAILDGGPAWAGIESTVVDLSGPLPRLLRPGPIQPRDIEAIIGPLQRNARIRDSEPLPSPGMLARHYAPVTPLECLKGDAAAPKYIELLGEGKKAALLGFGIEVSDGERGIALAMPTDPVRFAEDLFEILHELDRRGLDRILVELPPETDEWLAVRDRLLRASTGGG